MALESVPIWFESGLAAAGFCSSGVAGWVYAAKALICPDTPRIARAVTRLTDELNNTPAHIPGDPLPITSRVRPT